MPRHLGSPGNPSSRLRTLLVLGAVGLLGVTLAVTINTSANAAASLGAGAAMSGRFFGTAVGATNLNDSTYSSLLATEFTMVTPDNELKWEFTEPSRNQYYFVKADAIAARAAALGVPMRGRVLVWHSQLPAWVNAIASPTELATAMQNHINIVMGRYKGRINAWEVVNEAFADNGSVRTSVFSARLGSNTSWIETAFRTARAADPAAKLCYADYNIESWDNPKTQAVYAMVRDFKTRGVPIDCVGFQAHFTATWPVPSSFQTTMQSFAALGVDVQLTELDVEGTGAAQANSYSTAVAVCLAVSHCTGISVSQIRDSDSFRGGATPLLFDRYGAKKPAYDAVLARFYPGPVTPPVPSTSAPVTSPPVTSSPLVTTRQVPTTSASGQPGACTATYRLVSAWQGGFQAEVTIRNNSATTIYSWTASLGLRSGQSTNNLWNGVPGATSGTIAVRNAPHNGTLAGSGTTSFGFVASGPSTPAPTVSCSTP
ncbi:hypothetical protein GCM10009682_19890 [Luedemannella flava]|uniref:Beta-xylanase n=1 Tax=Luedemannella flava TaxID=349316 RepID=A0ABN2LT43_9ACTN